MKDDNWQLHSKHKDNIYGGMKMVNNTQKTLRQIVDEDKSKRPMTKFVPLIKFEEYAPKFKQHFNLTKREDGVVLAELSTNGKELKWSLEQHRANWQLFMYLAQDSDVEVVILTNYGKDWIRHWDNNSFLIEKENEAWSTYELEYIDGRRSIQYLINNIEVPTIGAIRGSGLHMELGMMMDITLMADDVVFSDPHFGISLVPGDGIATCFIETMGLKRASYAMLTNQLITAHQALEYGMVNEVLPYDDVVPRAYELADLLMTQHRTIRRLTTQVVRKPWKDALANSGIDFVFATEMYGNMCLDFTHDGINTGEVYDGSGKKIIENSNEEQQKHYENIRSRTERYDWIDHKDVLDD